MSLKHWKNFDDFFIDPWRPHRDLFPYWRQYHPWHDDFGFGIPPLEFSREFRDMERQARQLHNEFINSTPFTGKDSFQVTLDVQNFSPNEISVKTNDNSVLIEAKHEERQDQHGFISRQFTRRFTLPPGCDANTISSELSSDGALTIKAPKAPENSNEKIIPIHYTGFNVRENKAIEK
jgi:HSP20 family molecular chaperone IbpA